MIESKKYNTGKRSLLYTDQAYFRSNTIYPKLSHDSLNSTHKQKNKNPANKISALPFTRIQKYPSVLSRGTNPADCMKGICTNLNKRKKPRSVSAAKTLTNNWLKGMLKCLHNNAPKSNASHRAQIVKNEELELKKDAKSLKNYFKQVKPSASSLRDYIEDLRRDCKNKQREIGIEFNYNIVLDNSGLLWGYHPATNWDAIESAFATMPPEATWQSPKLLTFKREEVHASQPSTGGQTDVKTGNITIFNRGFGAIPYSRSSATNISTTTQTIQHEVGHIITSRIPKNEYNNFFKNIVPWKSYSWAWINALNSPHANYQAQQKSLMSESGMNKKQLATWLPTLKLDSRTNRGGKSYFRSKYFLESYNKKDVPDIPAFKYAASNKDEYLSELYTFCISNPDFVYKHLPKEQINWLKRVVFHFPTDINDILKHYAIGEPQQTEFIRKIMKVFIWKHVDMAFREVMINRPMNDQGRIA